MAYENMERAAMDTVHPNTGAVYHTVIELADSEASDEYILPVQAIYGIAVEITGNGTVSFTIDPPEVIEAGTATYVAWNGTDAISLAVTGFKAVSVSGAVTVRATVKTEEW